MMADDKNDFGFILTDGERTHPLWIRLKKHFEDKLNEARIKNDNMSLNQFETMELRGRIKVIKSLISLDDERPVVD